MPSATPSPPPSKSGITTSPNGTRHIPSSVRADGSKRKEIRIRPGYKPPEDVEVYKNRTAEAFKQRGTGGVPGAEGLDQNGVNGLSNNKNAKRREARKRAKASENGMEEVAVVDWPENDDGFNGKSWDDDDVTDMNGTDANEVSKILKAMTPLSSNPTKINSTLKSSTSTLRTTTDSKRVPPPAPSEPQSELDPEAEKEKQAKKLQKKLRQARELREKKDKGQGLLPEQFEKVIKINELIRQLDSLGFDGDGEKKVGK